MKNILKKQRKLLAIDGGGIRGILAIQILRKIETILRNQSGNSSLCLSDYFDYICGTSTGGIIAACLAVGMDLDEIESLYLKEAPRMFKLTRNPIKRLLYARYDACELRERMRDIFGKDTTLGSSEIKTLLMLVMLNVSTSSPWPVSSNPKAKYNSIEFGDENNLNLPLWQLVSASAAAPYFFEPEEIKIGSSRHLFFDGALTSLNNPAFKLFQMATLPAYNLNWETGQDKLLLVSIGTGLFPRNFPSPRLIDKQIATTLAVSMQSLMFSSTAEVDLQCRTFGNVLFGEPIDSEVGDLVDQSPIGKSPLFSYARYNPLLTEKGLEQIGCKDYAKTDFKLDNLESIDACIQIGKAIAGKQVIEDHFKNFPY